MSDDLRATAWMPLRMPEGVRTVGLSEAFRLAGEARGLLGRPGERAAMLRLMIAITARAGGLDRVEGYLDEHQDGFKLLDAERPFMQHPGLDWASPHDPSVGPLLPQRGHLSPRTPTRLSIAEAALALVRLQTYAPAGITGATVGDPRATRGKVMPIGAGLGVRGTLLIPEGATLAETIKLSLPAVAGESLPAPWEGGGPQLGDEPRGPVDLLTWPSRRVRLVADTTGDSVVDVVYSAGVPLDDATIVGMDPHLAWHLRAAWKPWAATSTRSHVWTVLLDIHPAKPSDPPSMIPPPALRALPARVALRQVSAHSDKYRTVLDDETTDCIDILGDLNSTVGELRRLHSGMMALAHLPLWLRASAGSAETAISPADMESALACAERHAVAAAVGRPRWRNEAHLALMEAIDDAARIPAATLAVRKPSPDLSGWPSDAPLSAAVAVRIARAWVRKNLAESAPQ